MGSWGPGNLEGDGPQDTLADYCNELFQRVIDLLQHPRGHEYDDEEIDQLFVTIEIIFAMSERGLVNSSPPSAQLRALFPNYISRFCAYMEEGGGLWEERKKVIEASLERLAQIADGVEHGSFLHRLDLIMKKMEERDDE